MIVTLDKFTGIKDLLDISHAEEIVFTGKVKTEFLLAIAGHISPYPREDREILEKLVHSTKIVATREKIEPSETFGYMLGYYFRYE